MEKAVKVLLVGDTIVDKTTFCTFAGADLETASVPKATYDRDKINFGGAANVARNITALGHQCWFVTSVRYPQYIDDLEGEGIELLLVNGHIAFDNIKQRFMVSMPGNISYNHLQLNRVNPETPTDEPIAYTTTLVKIETLLPKMDVVAISDYRCGLLSSNAFKQWLIAKAKEYNKPIYVSSQVSSKEPNFLDYEGADFFCMNRDEYDKTVAQAGLNPYNNCMNNLLEKLKCKGLFITEGEKGAALYNGLKNRMGHHHCKPPKVAVKNIIGAGDAFFSMIVCLYNDPPHALKVANHWAALKASKPFEELPTLLELIESLGIKCTA